MMIFATQPTFVQLARHRPWTILAVGALLLAAVALLDWLTGPDFAMGPLYLVPVVLVAAALGRRYGAAGAVVTVTVWTMAELLGAASYSHQYVAIPNGLLRVAYFIIVVYVVAAWRDMGLRLEAEVERRTRELVSEVAERRAAEEAVHRLTLQIANAEDVERRRLAQDIHDTIGQNLTLVKFCLQSMAAVRSPNGAGVETIEPQVQLDESLRLLDDAIAQTRTLTFELYPPMLDDLGLAAALRWLARDVGRQTQAEIAVSEEGTPRKLTRSAGSYIFRSIKELVSNAIKHGGSTEIIVTLYWRPQSLRATVDDNGSGFDATAGQDAGLGLPSIRERVSSLGGSISIESEQGSGARVILDIPTSETA